MNGKRIVWKLALGAALLVGCDRKDDPANPPASPTPPAPDVTPKADGGGSDGAALDTGTGATSPAGTSDDMPADAGTSTTTTPEPKAAGTGDGAGTSPTDVAADDGGDPAKAKEAQEYLSQTAQHMSDKKPDLALDSLEKAEAMADSLPKTLREEIKTMRKNVDSMSKPADLPALTDDENK